MKRTVGSGAGRDETEDTRKKNQQKSRLGKRQETEQRVNKQGKTEQSIGKLRVFAK
jgi:hypothetical protein